MAERKREKGSGEKITMGREKERERSKGEILSGSEIRQVVTVDFYTDARSVVRINEGWKHRKTERLIDIYNRKTVKGE